MKKFLIILTIFVGTLGACFLFTQYFSVRQHYMQQIPLKLDNKSSFYLGYSFERLIEDECFSKWYENNYTGNMSGYLSNIYDLVYYQNEQKDIEQQLATYRECKKQLVGHKPKVEILRVMRTASSFVMNSPAYYNRDISNNTIEEDGRGADEEDIYILYLSDGTVLKASPRDKPQWLGTKVGEKVRKTISCEAVLHDNAYKVDTIVRYSPLYE